MARRRSFVPSNPTGAALESRLAPSVGGWFTSNFRHLSDSLGITHAKNKNAASGIEQLWKNQDHLNHPAPQGHIHHAAKVK